MRISDTRIADFGKSEIVEVINTYVNNMRLDYISSYVYTNIRGNKPSNPLEWSILFDPISILPNSCIEYAIIRSKRGSDYSELPEKICLFIAYDSNYASEDIERVDTVMNLLLKNHHVYTLYFNSAIFRYDRSLHFIPDVLWKMISDVLAEDPCNKLIYEKQYVRVHRNVIS